jgi:hypothetical protein
VFEQSRSAESAVRVDADETDSSDNFIIKEPGCWKDTEWGYLPNGNQADIIFSNNLLEWFYNTSRKHFPRKSQFRKVFIQEKNRQWDIKKKKDKIEKQYTFLSSDNPAAVGMRLNSSYVPKPNDRVVLRNVGEHLSTLLDDANSLKKKN